MQQQIQDAIIKGLESGESLEKIFEMSRIAEISDIEIEKSLRVLAHDPKTKKKFYYKVLEPYAVELYWDPFGSMPTENELAINNRDSIDLFNKWKRNPRIIERNVFLQNLTAILITLLFLLFLLLIPLFPGDLGYSILYISILIGPPFVAIILVLVGGPSTSIVEENIIKYILARDFGWKYSPIVSRERMNRACERFEEIFLAKNGSSPLIIKDEFWGVYKGVSFWAGGILHDKKFVYPGEEGGAYCVFGFKLPSSLDARFLVETEKDHYEYKMKNKIEGRDIKTESTAFNKNFKVSYFGDPDIEKPYILNILSPYILTTFVKIKKKLGDFVVLFAEDAVFFYVPGEFIDKMKTDFQKNGVYIDSEDIENISMKLNMFLGLPMGIIKYLKGR